MCLIYSGDHLGCAPEDEFTNWETVPDGFTQVIAVDWLIPNIPA